MLPLLALSHDDAVATQLAVYFELMLLRLRAAACLRYETWPGRALSGCLFCSSGLPLGFEFSGCLVLFMSFSQVHEWSKPRPFLAS